MSFRLGPRRLQTQQPGDEDRRGQREAQASTPCSGEQTRQVAGRPPGRRPGLLHLRCVTVTTGPRGGLTVLRAGSWHCRARVSLRVAVQGGLQAQQSLAGPAAVRPRRPWCRQPSAARFLKAPPSLKPATACHTHGPRPHPLRCQPEKALCSRRAPATRPGSLLWLAAVNWSVA